jgi:prepilin-type N-terminal cleavage/methylation domain-containing protein/prepilin-type processing-associated H-X9-DG protein
MEKMRSRAFTLIELLVVIAIIAILMAVLMPSLNLARDHAKRVHCVSNTKTLALGWYMYQDEFGGRLVPAHTTDNPIQWVGNEPTTGTWEQKKDSIRRGLLFPYVGKVVDIYRCPADPRRPSAARLVAFRTFSIVGGANGETWDGYTKATIYSQIKQPSMKYVLVEEADTRGINMGSWQMNPRNRTWVDPVSMWHSKKTTLGFADGHAEMHPWEDQYFIDWNLKAMYGEPSFSFYQTPPADAQTDIDYMVKGYACKSVP